MKNLLTVILQITCLCFLIMAFNNFSIALPVAVKIEKENIILIEIKKDLMDLKAPYWKISDLSNAVYTAHTSTGLNPKLITSLMYTESNFKTDAIGPINRTKIRYKGLMQTPTATWFSDVDTLHGARILKEKLLITNNNLRLALALYKGGDNPVAKKQADYVLKVYKNLM